MAKRVSRLKERSKCQAGTEQPSRPAVSRAEAQDSFIILMPSDTGTSQLLTMDTKPGNPEKEVKAWGFSHVFTWSDGPHYHYSPHSHRGLTTHLITKGQLTIAYPKEKDAEKKTYGVGERIDVEAGRVHEVWIGPEGCTYVIGE